MHQQHKDTTKHLRLSSTPNGRHIIIPINHPVVVFTMYVMITQKSALCIDLKKKFIIKDAPNKNGRSDRETSHLHLFPAVIHHLFFVLHLIVPDSFIASPLFSKAPSKLTHFGKYVFGRCSLLDLPINFSLPCILATSGKKKHKAISH